MSIQDLEQQALSAFLAASEACMRVSASDDRSCNHCEQLCDQAIAFEADYVRELLRPIRRLAG
jgi:hypothetical protein